LVVLHPSSSDPTDHSKTEVTELQILHEHQGLVTAICASDAHRAVVSASTDGGTLIVRTFPAGRARYRMAGGDDVAEASARWDGAGKGLAVHPDRPTAVCPGPRVCKVGKTGLVRSSSSFQVRFQLRPKVATAECRVLLPKRRIPLTLPEEWPSDSDEDSDCEIELSSSSEEDEEEHE